MSHKTLIQSKNHFIYSDGYLTRILNGKEVLVPIQIIRGKPKVKINNNKYDFVLLMLQYFGESKYKYDIAYTFRMKDNKIPLSNIKIRNSENIENEDERLIYEYKCKEKASSQNTRVGNVNQISAEDILNALKRTDFKCQYCNKKINRSSWHIDHVHPLSNGGQNDFKNITPSCKYCNLMKGSIVLDKFLYQVKTIYENYNLSEKYNNKNSD